MALGWFLGMALCGAEGAGVPTSSALNCRSGMAACNQVGAVVQLTW